MEEWYRDRYGEKALAAKGNQPLVGVLLVRGAPFLVNVPMHRRVIEVEGKTAWMYFEAGIGEGENPRDWLVHAPNFARLTEDQTSALDGDLAHVANALRAVQHHLLGVAQDETQAGLRASIRSYLESAARRIHAQTGEEFAFAWMDLQMASEAALKLIIFRAKGAHPRVHGIAELAAHDGATSAQFDRALLGGWPDFKTISNRRYGKDYMAGLAELYEAYQLTLNLVAACVRTIDPPLASGSGLLLHIAPWLIDEPILARRNKIEEAED